MSFARPELLVALWGLGLIPLLYLVRRRRRRQRVAHLFLWERVLARQGRPRLTRIRALISILLQMAIAAALILAAAKPVTPAKRALARELHVIVDRSLSMSARDASGLRRDEEARRWLDEQADVFFAGRRRRPLLLGRRIALRALSWR